MLQIIQNNR